MRYVRSALTTIPMVVFVTVVAAQPKPNFSGHWIPIDVDASSGGEQFVEHDATTLTVSHSSGHGGHRSVYHLDGSERRNVLAPHPGEQIVSLSRASWKDGRLTIATTTNYWDGRRSQQEQVWSFDAEGRLVIEFVRSVTGVAPTTSIQTYRRR